MKFAIHNERMREALLRLGIDIIATAQDRVVIKWVDGLTDFQKGDNDPLYKLLAYLEPELEEEE